MKTNINTRELKIKLWNAYSIHKALTKEEAFALIELVTEEEVKDSKKLINIL
tara:strand:+ start:691 stop:846 length:156 start_codon:yes stop_codon:yes gene_type:complete